MNLLGLDLGFGGLGVYMSKPPAQLDTVVGKWFAVFEVNLANLRIGGNLAPNRPNNDRVPDPDAHRAMVRQQREDGVPVDHTLQRYPFGTYSYVELSFPIQVRVWKMVRDDLGFGFFVESTVFGFEWPLDRKVSRFAQVYNVLFGFSTTF